MIAKTTHRQPWLAWRNGPRHQRLLWLFMVIVLGHWSEHLAQIYQVYGLGWLPQEAGGALGVWFPRTNASEVLHFTYNLFLWGGILLLQPGFRGQARRWWNGALAIQSWHFFEHILLQVQWLTGYYLFGAAKQISIGELWFPRMELHFVYNLLVFVPLMVAMYSYFQSQPPQRPHQRTEAPIEQFSVG